MNYALHVLHLERQDIMSRMKNTASDETRTIIKKSLKDIDEAIKLIKEHGSLAK